MTFKTNPALIERDAKIVEAAKIGQKRRDIAKAFGVTKQRISQIVKTALGAWPKPN